jgi:hypothetical protein
VKIQAGFNVALEQSTTTGTGLSFLLNILILDWKGTFQDVRKIGGLDKFGGFKDLNIRKGPDENGNNLSGHH